MGGRGIQAAGLALLRSCAAGTWPGTSGKLGADTPAFGINKPNPVPGPLEASKHMAIDKLSSTELVSQYFLTTSEQFDTLSSQTLCSGPRSVSSTVADWLSCA